MEQGAAAAIMGVTIGTALSMLFLAVYLLRNRGSGVSLDVPDSSGKLIRQILIIGVPITLSNSAMSIITLVDTSIVLGRLQDGLGLTEVAARPVMATLLARRCFHAYAVLSPRGGGQIAALYDRSGSPVKA